MSRWASLKPDKTPQNGNLKNSRAQKNTQSRQQSRLRSTACSNEQIHPLRDDFKEIIRTQLALYRSASNNFDAEELRIAIKGIPSLERASARSRGQYLVLLVEILCVQDRAMQEQAIANVKNILSSENVHLKQSEAISCSRILTSHFERNTSEECLSLQCICRLLHLQAAQLPAEETATSIVRGVFLRTREATDMTSEILLALSKLLQIPCHQSAILSSLIQDVSLIGGVEMTPNPTRKDLFRFLQAKLFSNRESFEIRSEVLVTLRHAVLAVRKVDGSNADITGDIDQVALDSFLLEQLSDCRNDLFIPATSLLHSLLRTYPSDMTSLASRLLLASPPNSYIIRGPSWEKCALCCSATEEMAPFLSALHNVQQSGGGDGASLELDCLADLINLLPVQLWLRVSVPGRGDSGIHQVAIKAMKHILSIARCTLLRASFHSKSVCRLLLVLFMKIVWHNEELVEAGVHLWSTLILYVLDEDRPFNERESLSEAAVGIMGGKVNPQGDRVLMAKPAHVWLQRESTVALVLSMFRKIQMDNQCILEKKLLCAMVRTRPETVEYLGEDLLDIFRPRNQSSLPQLDPMTSLDLLESLSLGKRDFPPSRGVQFLDNSKTLARASFATLESYRDDESTQIRLKVFDIYASLLDTDWSCLEMRILDHIDGILLHCDEQNGKVRVSACKAIAEFCNFISPLSGYFSGDKSSLRNMTKRICDVMCHIVAEDKVVAVRSMALLVLGNLSYESNGKVFLESCPPKEVARIGRLMCQFLKETNDKVVANAIRALGHWGAMLVRGKNFDHYSDEVSCLIYMLENITSKLSGALILVSENDRLFLSWRERSARKKHGWGACNSLSRIFASACKVDNQVNRLWDNPLWSEAVAVSFKVLQRCIRQQSVQFEKIVISAMATIRVLQPEYLESIVKGSNMDPAVTASIVTICIGIIYKGRDEGRGKVFHQASSLLKHIFELVSVSEIVCVLKEDSITGPVIEVLYTWMTENDLRGRCFEVIALGLHHGDFGIPNDVSLEQNFASRASLTYKKYETSQANKVEGDEL